LNFEVKGNGKFRAACNGDATSLELFHKPAMKVFSGRLVVLVQAASDVGDIELTVCGDGLVESKIKIYTK
jgi:beta-galactosidase